MGCPEWNRWMGGMRLKNISLALRQRTGLLPIALAGSALMIACGTAAQPVDSKPVRRPPLGVLCTLGYCGSLEPCSGFHYPNSPIPNGDGRHVISSGNSSLNYS